MATLANLNVVLGFKDEGFSSGIAGAKSKLDSLGKSMVNTGKMLTAGVTLPLVGAGIAAIKWASDVDQAIGKSEAVFEDQSKVVEDWSKTTAHAYGFAQSESLAMASTYGSLFKVMGQTNGVAADQSMVLVGLAADMAAFNDVSNARASEALMAGLTGEYTSLKSMGVFLNEATVNQEALTIAQRDGRDAITEADKVQARYNIIMEQTAQQQGQAAREAGNFASQMERVRAKIKDTGAAMGRIMMPYVLDFLSYLQNLLDRFNELDPKWQKIILAVAAFAAALGPALMVLGMMVPGISALVAVLGFLISPIGLVVIALAALIGLGIYAFINDLWGVRDAVYSVIDALRVFEPMLGDIMDVFQAAREGDWGEVFDELKDAAISFGQALFELQGIVLQALAGIFGNLLDWIQGYDWYGLLNSVGTQLNEGLMAGLQMLSDAAFPVLQEWANGVVLILSTLKTMAVEQISGMALAIVMYFGLLASDIKAQVDAIQSSVSAAFTLAKITAVSLATELATAVGSKFIDLWNSVKGTALLIKNSVVTEFTDAKTKATTLVSELATAVGSKFIDLWNSVKGTALLIKNSIVTEFQNAVPGVTSAMASLTSAVVGALISLVGTAYSMASSVGNAIGAGIKAGIEGMIDAVIGAAQGLLDAAMGILSNVPGFSPIAHVGEHFGSQLGGGFAEGIASLERRVGASSDALVAAAIAPLDASVSPSGSMDAALGGTNGGNTYVSISLKSQELIDLIRNAEDGGEFSRNFGSQLGLYGGTP